ncbi:MAG: aldo/keto reductase, partial [Actinobacteria bacterium]|nr:aldo/keto reductase [Actinomycetota bacterium]
MATKTENRDKSTYTKNLDASLRNLKTDYIDIHIIHAIGFKYPEVGTRFDDLKEALAPGGALEGAQEAIKKGKIRFIGISMHGQPDVLIEAINQYPFDAVMTTINYYD